MTHPASNLLIAALSYIGYQIENVNTAPNPMYNSGAGFECDTFKAEAYQWNELDTMDNPIPNQQNFFWRDLEVHWYKWLGRDTFTNRKIWPDEINEMLEECLAALMAHENNKEELLY